MNQTTDATPLFAPLWKRKWLILLAGILAAAGAYAYFKHKRPTYSVSTQIYLSAGAEEQGVTLRKAQLPNPTNAATIINSPLIQAAVNRRLHAKNTVAARLASISRAHAGASEKSQFVPIVAEGPSPRAVALRANMTAQVYIERQHEASVRNTERQISLARRQLLRVEAALATPVTKGKGGKSGGAGASASETLQATNLNAKINQLESQLSVSGVKQLGVAFPGGALKLGSDPKKNAIFAFFIGIFVASVIAYMLSRFDRRIPSLIALEDIFQTQVLAALPEARRPIVRHDGRLAPSRHIYEPMLRLHTTLRLGEAIDGHRAGPPRSILLLSADPGDGKSTVAAALSLVARDAAEHALLIEADFRRPVLARMLGVQPRHGLTQVLSGALVLEDAVQAVGAVRGATELDASHAQAGVTTTVRTSSAGTLSLLAGESGISNPPGLLGSEAMRGLLRAAVEEYDQTLVDGPAPLQASDLMPLLAAVDGIVIVARIGHTRDVSARRLVQLLARTPSAPVLGLVANAVSSAEMERYGFSLAQNHRGLRAKLIG